jgi:hypothetical protein
MRLTALRVLSAIVRGIRERALPCLGVAAELGTKHRGVVHHASLPWQDVPTFLVRLRGVDQWRSPITLLALEFLILTASRSGETRGALWAALGPLPSDGPSAPAIEIEAQAAGRRSVGSDW